LGLGVGIIAAMAFDPKRDGKLHAVDAGHLFRDNTTRIAIKRAAYLRRYTYAFIQMFAPQLTPEIVDKTRRAKGESYEL
jgi:hypothetical protein